MQVFEHCNDQAYAPAQHLPDGLCCAPALGRKEELEELAADQNVMYWQVLMPEQQSTQNTTQSFSLKSLRVTATSQLAQLVCTTCGKQGIWVLAKSKTPHSLCLQSSSYLGFALYKTAKLNTTVLLAALSYPAFSH